MSPAFPARRRAEQFDAMVEGTPPASLDAAPGDLLELVATLRTMPRVEARPEFVVALRERLMVAAATELTAGAGATTGPVIRPQRSHRDRRLATALGGFALVGATASMAVAAQNALPGDELYPMKRAMENAHAHLSVGNDSKGSTLLANASGRLAEIDELTHGDHAGSADADVIATTLGAFTDQATEASDLLLDAYAEDGDEGAISELTSFSDASLDILDGLAPDVPADARGALAEARQTIASIKGAAAEACPLCAAVLGADEVTAAAGPTLVTNPPVALPVEIVRPHTSVLIVPHPAATTPAAQTTPDPVTPPTVDPTVGPTPTQPPATSAPGATGFPTSSSTGTGQPGGGSADPDHDGNPLDEVTQGIHVSNPADPAAAMSQAVEVVAGAVSGVPGLLGDGHKQVKPTPRDGQKDAQPDADQDGADSGKGLLGP